MSLKWMRKRGNKNKEITGEKLTKGVRKSERKKEKVIVGGQKEYNECE